MSPPKRATHATEELRASLITHAQRFIAREGASALTMRALAVEAGCAVGLPYKVFANRRELVAEMLHAELTRLDDAFDELVRRAGTGTVSANLARFADLLLDSPAVGLVQEVFADEALAHAVTDKSHATGVGPASFAATVAGYLAAEQAAGRVDPDVDTAAFGFVIAGAIHNLIASGDGYPHPTRTQLRRWLTAIADRL